MLFMIMGASGSGKTTQFRGLEGLVAAAAVHDLDDPFGEPAKPTELDREWRALQTEGWVQHALALQGGGQDTVLVGGVFGELLACPSATGLDGIAGCLLDCEENERLRRLRARDPERDLTDDELWPHLIWSAWLRLHRCDPSWLARPLRGADPGSPSEGVAPWLEWSRWESWEAGDPRWSFHRLDTTHRAPAETTRKLLKWIDEQRRLGRTGRLPLSGTWWD